MNDDDLRARLRRVDPAAADASVDRASAARAQSLLEAIMSTPVDAVTPTTPDETARPRPARRWLVPLGAAAAVAGIALAATLVGGDGGGAPTRTAERKSLTLTAPDGTTMASCLMFDVQILKGMSPAFGGTVTEVSSGSVVLAVDRWYAPKGSDVTHVELRTGSDVPVSIDGIEFEQGKRYLVTAANGTVNTCGYSGLATPEYEEKFDEAFGG